MFSRIALISAAGLLAVACASNPAPVGGGTVTPDAAPSVTSAPAAAAGTATISNMAASTSWWAEEKLIPEDPALALVVTGIRDTDKNAGVYAECNAANGAITMHLGKQAGRTGSATFKIRAGAGTRDINGKFSTKASTNETSFTFPVTSADLLALGQPDMVSFVSDRGEVEWALVKNTTAQVQAKYVGSLAGFGAAASDFLNYCNPK
jgi:hypothetical protein